jgi:uncharacterized protein
VDTRTPPRLQGLPTAVVLGREVPVATGSRCRLLGLAWLDRGEAGAGLLIPRCASVHTFGMRFALDLYFLDEAGAVLLSHQRTPPRRVVSCPAAHATLEIPSSEGESFQARGLRAGTCSRSEKR